MKYKFYFVALILFLPSEVASRETNNAPPLVPNICSERLCLEVFSIPRPRDHRFEKPRFSYENVDNKSKIVISYNEIGSVTISNFEDNTIDGIKNKSINIAGSCKNLGDCENFYIFATSKSPDFSDEYLKCRIGHLWLMNNGEYGSAEGKIYLQYKKILSLAMADGTCKML